MTKFYFSVFTLFLSTSLFSFENTAADTIDLENVVVSASLIKRTEPATFQLISHSEIQNVYQGQDPSSLLEKISPSIISYSDAGSDIGNYVQFRMRGMDQTRINTSLNGIPLNDMIDQGVFFSNFSDLGSSVQNIQVQRGVGITNGGMAAYAGAINFESLNLFNEKPMADFQLTTGSFNTLRTIGQLKVNSKDSKLAFYSRLSNTRSGGYKDHSGSDAFSLFLSGGYVGKNDLLRVTAFAGKTQNDQAYLPVLLSDINTHPRTNYNHANDTDDFAQEMVQVQYSRNLSENTSMSSSLYYNGARGVFPFSLDPDTQLMFGLENEHYGLLSEWEYSKKKFTLNAGFHAYTFDRKNENYTAPNRSNPDYSDRSEKDEISLFGKLGYDFGKWKINADFHVRSVQLGFIADEILSFGGSVPSGSVDYERSWLFVNPKVGLGFDISKNTLVYLSYGRTGREPTRTDILQGDGSSINEFNFASASDENVVMEEYVNDWELGFRKISDDFTLDVTAFYMDFQNEISLVGALAQRSYVPLRTNIPDSKRSGLEVTAHYAFNTKLDLGFRTTFLHTSVSSFDNGTEIFQGVSHIFAPKWIINPFLDYAVSQRMSLSLSGRSVSNSFMELSNDPDFMLDAYFILNAQMDFQISDKIQIKLFANNLFDELYFNDGAPVDIDFDGSVEGPGFRIQPLRNFFIQLHISLF